MPIVFVEPVDMVAVHIEPVQPLQNQPVVDHTLLVLTLVSCQTQAVNMPVLPLVQPLAEAAVDLLPTARTR